MSLSRLDIYQVRNIHEQKLSDLTRINIFTGLNGAGKTSLLEAIYLLGTGRSFRGGRSSPIISHNAEALTVFGGLTPNIETMDRCIGLTKLRSGSLKIHLNKREISTRAELANALPIQAINSDAFLLIDGGSKIRRNFMDWGAFHVKHDFIDAWRRTQRCLKQRNAVLKQPRQFNDRISSWDVELSRAAKIVDTARSEYINDILPLFGSILKRLSVDSPTVSVLYKRGWSSGVDLMESLNECVERDYKYATTTTGPHRANLEITIDNKLATEVLSRGQKKIVVSALKLAQGQYFMQATGRQCIYLIDDLSAELDRSRRSYFCELLDEMGCQVFVTTTDVGTIDYKWKRPEEVSWFHVEQGLIGKQFEQSKFKGKAIL